MTIWPSILLLFIVPFGILLAFKTATHGPKTTYAQRLNGWVDRILNFLAILDNFDRDIEELEEKLTRKEPISLPMTYLAVPQPPDPEYISEGSRHLSTLAFSPLIRNEIRGKDRELVKVCERIFYDYVVPLSGCMARIMRDELYSSIFQVIQRRNLAPGLAAELGTLRELRARAQPDICLLEEVYREWYRPVGRGISYFGRFDTLLETLGPRFSRLTSRLDRFGIEAIPELEFNPPPQKYLQRGR